MQTGTTQTGTTHTATTHTATAHTATTHAATARLSTRRRRAPRRGLRWIVVALLAAVAASAAACSDDAAQDTAASTTTVSTADDGTTGDGGTTDDGTTEDAADAAYVSDVYSDPASWLCRPELTDDACSIDLDATRVALDGTTTVEPFVPATDAPVDCFYVYPTISTDPGTNSDLVPGDAELGIAASQAARFGEVCNVYAPVYRQITLASLFSRTDEERAAGTETQEAIDARETAYADVVDSFRHYLANDNDGRPFVLIGHSQGAGVLNRLVAEEIDRDDALRDQMLSAMLIGSSVTEGALESIPACAEPTDTGCVISFASFYEAEPPPADSFFGRPRSGGGRALCTNPASLGGGAAPLDAYFQAGHVEGSPAVDTPWIRYEGLISGECLTEGPFDWLSVTVEPAGSGLPDDLGGRITPQWGLHLADVNLVLGDLVELVRTQSSAG